MSRRTAVAAGLTTCLTAALTLVPAASTPGAAGTSVSADGGVKVIDKCLISKPDPGTEERVQICYSLFKPAGASARNKVPMLMHSHGWGGSRATDPAALREYLDAGYGMLSFDQRGWGESGGQAYVENPRVEGHDVRRLVRVISKLRWVQQDGLGDPRMGAVGGSYGGGYQFLIAFEELRTSGKPVLDALAPEITWNDLSESLAPEGVVRSEWALSLSATAVPSDALPHNIYKALVEGAATGTWPDGNIPGTENLEKFFKRNGPKWHVDHGRKLDIPVLLGQGTTDTLFNLQQGLDNWRTAITKRARRHSIFVGYNGGHVLPSVFPQGVNVTSDPCSKKLGGGDFRRLSISFFDETLKGRDTKLRGWGKLHIATPDSSCTTVRKAGPDTTIGLGTVASPAAAGAPLPYEVSAEPIRVAGSSYLTGRLTSTPGSRAFVGLGVGSSPTDVTLVQNNVLPINVTELVNGTRVRVQLPAVAVDVGEGRQLYLVVSAISDTFAGMGSRTPGAVVLENAKVHLPVLG